MENGVGEPQVVVLLGGTSEIGQAIVRRLAGRRSAPWCWRLATRGRPPTSPRELRSRGSRPWIRSPVDAADHAGHDALVQAPRGAPRRSLDVVIQAFECSATRPGSTPIRPQRRPRST